MTPVDKANNADVLDCKLDHAKADIEGRAAGGPDPFEGDCTQLGQDEPRQGETIDKEAFGAGEDSVREFVL